MQANISGDPRPRQTAVRQHANLRRSHSPLYDYTALWAHDLIARGPRRSSTAPDSSSSTNPLNPIAVHDRMVAARRRWTRWVCLGAVVCLLVNVASTVFVVVAINSDTDLVTDSALLRQFMSQDGSADFLDRRYIWKNQVAYSNPRNADGSSPHTNATPVAIHFLLGPSTGEAAEEGIVIGWKPSHRKYLEGVEYQVTRGRFNIMKSGVYQVYCQLSFTCPANESFVEFKQELRDNTGKSLLEDAESTDCRGMSTHVPGHVSFMMSVVHLQQGRTLHLWTNRPHQLDQLRTQPFSFFGIFKLRLH